MLFTSATFQALTITLREFGLFFVCAWHGQLKQLYNKIDTKNTDGSVKLVTVDNDLVVIDMGVAQ